MKKQFLIICSILMTAFFIGCSQGNQPAVDYDTAVFNVPMKEALRASQDFVKQSV